MASTRAYRGTRYGMRQRRRQMVLNCSNGWRQSSQ
jgi:hypothetical protein